MKILLKDGIRYLPYKYKDEDELERLLVEHSEIIFGADSVTFPKRKIKARSGIATIPDGFVLLINEKKWYILEVELASHPLYEHIVVQISKFNSAIKNQNTRKKLIDVFYDEIENNIQIKYKLEFNKITKELYKFLSDTLNKDPEIIIVIDEQTKELDEVCEGLPFRTTVLNFETYQREEIGVGVHIHSFDTLKDYVIKEQPQPRKIDKTKVKGKEYSEEHHIKGKPKEVLELYRTIDKFCRELDPTAVQKKFLARYVRYAHEKNIFCCVHLQKSGLRVWLKLNYLDLESPPEYVRDVSNIGHWGVGDVELAIDSLERFQNAKFLIQKSFEENK